MKRRLFTFALAALTIGLLGSCSKINERIDGLDKRVYDLENGKIASIDQQIAAINQSIADLGTIRTNIQNLKNEQEAQGQDITALKAADITLEGKINDLKTYVDTELSKYATKDWANATFATLEQHQWTCDTIAKIDARIGALDAKLSLSISGLENSLKKWVNEQLDAYYTAAQMDAKLGVMQSEIDALKNSKDSERIDSIATELTKTKVAVDSAKTNIRSEYKAAIQSAIETSEGKLTQALKDSIAKVNDKIAALDTRVTTLELKMQAVEGRVDKLEAALGAYTELQGTITEIIKKLLADVGDKPQNEQDTTIWKCITALQAQCGTFGTAIETLQGLVGSKDVTTQISEAIASLISTQKLSGLADAVSALNDIVYGTGDVKSLTQQIADINTALSTTYATKTQLSQDIAAAKSELQSQIDSLCNVIGADGDATTATGIFKKIADLNAKVAALEAVNITIGSTNYTKWSDAVQAVLNKVNALGIGNISGLQSALNDLDARLDKIEAMIQSVSIVPAYSDGSVEAVDGILTLKCIVSPAKAISGMASLKDSLLLYADSVKVKTKATTPAYMTIKVSEASVLDAAQGAITLAADISEYLPKGEGKALTVAVNIKNGISDFTTEFVPVYVTNTTFKAVYNTNGGANTLTFYYDANDHSGEGITVYDNLPTAATTAADWGYNYKRSEIKSVVIDASVAGYESLTSTASMFQGMATATNISGAEYLDVSNVTDMSYMFQNFGGGTGRPTTLNVVPDVSQWNTGNVTNMTAMFASYGYLSSSLDKVPDVSDWNTGNVTDMADMFQNYGHESQTFNAVPDVSKWNTGKAEDMHQMFNEYGYKSTALNTVPNVSGWNTSNVTKINSLFKGYGNTSNNIDCTLDLSGWDLSKITGTNGENVFNFNKPKTFDVTIPAKTGGKPNEGGKWYYGNGTNSIAPPEGKTFTLEYVEIGGVKWATKNLGAEKETDYGYYFAWGATELAYSSFSSNKFTFVDSRPASYGGSGWIQNKGFDYENTPYYNGSDTITKYTDSDSKTVLESSDDAATALLGSGWRMPTKDDFISLANACNEGGYTIGSITLDDSHKNISTAVDVTAKGIYFCKNYEASDGIKGLLFCDGTNKLFFPAAGRCYGTSIKEGTNGFYWSSSLHTSSSFSAYYLFFNSGTVNPTSGFSRHSGMLVRPVKAAAAGDPGNGTEQYKNNNNPNWF